MMHYLFLDEVIKQNINMISLNSPDAHTGNSN